MGVISIAAAGDTASKPWLHFTLSSSHRLCTHEITLHLLADLAHQFVSVGFMRCPVSSEIAALQGHFSLFELSQLLGTDRQQVPGGGASGCAFRQEGAVTTEALRR